MSQQGMTIVSIVTSITPPFLDPGLKWSNKTGKVFDIEEPTA